MAKNDKIDALTLAIEKLLAKEVEPSLSVTSTSTEITATQAASQAATQAAIAAESAIALATKTADTAKALADAKAQSDINAAVLSNDIAYIKKDISEIKSSLAIFPTTFVQTPDFLEHKKIDENHENRIKALEVITTKIWSFGLAGLFVIA